MSAVATVGAVLFLLGSALPIERPQSLYRYCGGKCLCDGGVADVALMRRVCPSGTVEEMSAALRKARRREKARQRRLRELRQAEAAGLPSV